ncbi:hypothetical protein TWF694_003719 [Orbilia ellipsospora]|uniref:F-box domain-containing protein n=1 Tax=Orbilia ellipsospora TaxID=2528407 RepID=A0AAV9WZ27_9PEZI
MAVLSSLPVELHSEILSYLSPNDQVLASMSYRLWHKILLSPLFQEKRYLIPDDPPGCTLQIHRLLEITTSSMMVTMQDDKIVEYKLYHIIEPQDHHDSDDNNLATCLRKYDITNCDLLDEPVFRNIELMDGWKWWYEEWEDDTIGVVFRMGAVWRRPVGQWFWDHYTTDPDEPDVHETHANGMTVRQLVEEIGRRLRVGMERYTVSRWEGKERIKFRPVVLVPNGSQSREFNVSTDTEMRFDKRLWPILRGVIDFSKF